MVGWGTPPSKKNLSAPPPPPRSCPELSPCTVTRLRKTEFISSAVRDELTCVKSKLFLCEVVINGKYCKNIEGEIKPMIVDFLLLSLLNLLCCRTVAKLPSIMLMSSACYSFWNIVCCAVTYTVYTACGRRTARAYGDRLELSQMTLLTPDFSHNSMPLR